jgi:DNA recombination protein RmuC
MEIAFVVAAGAAGILLGVALGRYLWPVGGGLRALTEARLDAARLAERAASLALQIEDQSRQAKALAAERDLAREEKTATALEIARLTERERALLQKLGEQAAQAEGLQARLTAEFENIANRVLRANAAELSQTSQKSLGAVLEPLKERIQDFQKKVESTYEAETRQVLELKEQIRLAVETSREVGSKADGLAQALRGDSQMLGRWGEVVLERILEAAGLTQGREYIAQGRGMGLRNEEGGMQRPDIVVLLPENRTMVIDSKVPLAGYERLVGANASDERVQCAAAFVRDVKGHIDDLSGKRYQENPRLGAHDCVLMFLPIESALGAALSADPDLFAYGWDRRVVLVGPSTLLMTMRTVAALWRSELQSQNALEIARLAGELCDKIRLGMGDLNTVSEKMQLALAAHNEAVKRLSTGRGNALAVGERIRSLGVKTRGAMPAMLVDGGETVPDAEDYFAEIADAAQ